MMTKRFKKLLDDFKPNVIAKQLFGKVTNVGYYADTKELHEMLGIWTIEKTVQINREFMEQNQT